MLSIVQISLILPLVHTDKHTHTHIYKCIKNNNFLIRDWAERMKVRKHHFRELSLYHLSSIGSQLTLGESQGTP